jgi:hypothetical protein
LNAYDVYLKDGFGRPLSGVEIEKVALLISRVGHDDGESEAVAADEGGGRYRALGGYIFMPGDWKVAVLVRRQGHDDVRLPFTLSDVRSQSN